MKKLQIVCLLTITFISVITLSLSSQTINNKGGMLNHNGTTLSTVSNNNTQAVTNTVAKKGSVNFNAAGKSVLAVDVNLAKCAALDPQGHNSGTTHKNTKLHNCAAHCQALMKQNKMATGK